MPRRMRVLTVPSGTAQPLGDLEVTEAVVIGSSIASRCPGPSPASAERTRRRRSPSALSSSDLGRGGDCRRRVHRLALRPRQPEARSRSSARLRAIIREPGDRRPPPRVVVLRLAARPGGRRRASPLRPRRSCRGCGTSGRRRAGWSGHRRRRGRPDRPARSRRAAPPGYWRRRHGSHFGVPVGRLGPPRLIMACGPDHSSASCNSASNGAMKRHGMTPPGFAQMPTLRVISGLFYLI